MTMAEFDEPIFDDYDEFDDYNEPQNGDESYE
jgi:hypothetical protein